jgi:hypothetical protein
MASVQLNTSLWTQKSEIARAEGSRVSRNMGFGFPSLFHKSPVYTSAYGFAIRFYGQAKLSNLKHDPEQF